MQGDRIRKRDDWVNWLIPSSQRSVGGLPDRNQNVWTSHPSQNAEDELRKSGKMNDKIKWNKTKPFFFGVSNTHSLLQNDFRRSSDMPLSFQLLRIITTPTELEPRIHLPSFVYCTRKTLKLILTMRITTLEFHRHFVVVYVVRNNMLELWRYEILTQLALRGAC